MAMTERMMLTVEDSFLISPRPRTSKKIFIPAGSAVILLGEQHERSLSAYVDVFAAGHKGSMCIEALGIDMFGALDEMLTEIFVDD